VDCPKPAFAQSNKIHKAQTIRSFRPTDVANMPLLLFVTYLSCAEIFNNLTAFMLK
jgi:hypothetical protein